MGSLNYRAEVDGLRAFAIVPVLLFHFGLSWLPGGYLGVDVFFVISGYLIGAILLRETGDGTFRFSWFWMRRLRRIAPALLAMVIVSSAAAHMLMFGPLLKSVGLDAWAATFSFANFAMFLKPDDYWGTGADSSLFLHTWSLSVEEQFYLLFPLLLVAIHKLKAKPFPVLAVLTVLGFIAFVAGTVLKPKLTFYMLPTRAWELCLGATISVWPARAEKWMAVLGRTGVAAMAGLGLLLASFFLVSGEEGFTAAGAGAVLGAALLIAGVRGDSRGAWILTNRASVFIGKVSYSLYLWHWPVIVLSRAWSERFQADVPQTMQLALVIILSLLSYWLIESPLRKSKRFFPPFFALFAGAVFAAASLTWYPPAALDVSGYKMTSSFRQFDLTPSHLLKNPDAYKTTGVLAGSPQGEPKVVVIGDSHGAAWGGEFDLLGRLGGFRVAVFGLVSSQPFFSLPVKVENTLRKSDSKWSVKQRFDYASNLLEKLELWKPKIVVFACKWQNYLPAELDRFRDLARWVASRGATVLVLEQAPVFSFGNYSSREFLAYLKIPAERMTDVYLDLDPSDKWKQANRVVEALVKEIPGARWVAFSPDFQAGRRSLIMAGGEVLYSDEDHLSDAGTKRAGNRLAPLMNELLGVSVPLQNR